MKSEENALDLGLETLFFFGGALDGAGVFCVHLCLRERVSLSEGRGL